MPIPPQTERLKVIDAAILRNGAEMRALLLKARDKVQLDILKAVQSGNLANAAWLRDNLYAKLRQNYAGLQGDMAEWTKASTESIAQRWVGYAVEDLPRGDYKAAWSTFSDKYLENTVAKFSPSTMMDRAAVNAGQLDPVMGGMLKQDIDSLRKVVMDAQRLQAATGMTAQEFRKTVQDEVLKARGAWGFIDKAGRKWETKNYFNMLNRTLAAETSREAYRDTMAEAGYDLATVEGGIGPNCCDACEKWAGKIVSITGKTKGYPSQDEAISDGLFHPRCRHYLAVVLPGDEEQAKQDEKEMRDYAAEKGFPGTDSKVQPNDVETPKEEPPAPPPPVEVPALPPEPLDWVPATTVSESEAWAMAKLGRPSFAGDPALFPKLEKVDFKGLDVAATNQITRALAGLRAQGYTAPVLRNINTAVTDANAWASASSYEMSFSRNWMVPGRMKALEESLKDCVASQFHPPGCDTIKSIVDHEFGHVLTNWKLTPKGWREDSPLDKLIAPIQKAHTKVMAKTMREFGAVSWKKTGFTLNRKTWKKLEDEAVSILKKKSAFVQPADLRKIQMELGLARLAEMKKTLKARGFVSCYSKMNRYELIAESFTSVINSPPGEVSPFAQQVFDAVSTATPKTMLKPAIPKSFAK